MGKMVQFTRKFLIALATILFQNNPMLQTGFVLLVLFISFAIQMRFQPYMSTRKVTDVDYVHVSKSERMRKSATALESKIRRYGRILTGSNQVVASMKVPPSVRRRKSMALRDKDYKSVWRQSISNVVTLNKIAPERNWSVANDNGLHPLGFKNNNNQIQHEGYIGERQVDLMKLFIDTLFDYNALEALSLAVLIILMLIGLLIYNTNVSGLETFEEINTEQSTTTLVANIFVLFFIGLIWFLFILVSTLMVMSVIIDVSRNV